jgi:hypothetical protein
MAVVFFGSIMKTFLITLETYERKGPAMKKLLYVINAIVMILGVSGLFCPSNGYPEGAVGELPKYVPCDENGQVIPVQELEPSSGLTTTPRIRNMRGNSVLLQWLPVANANGYIIEYQTQMGRGNPIVVEGGAVNSYEHKIPLNSGYACNYKICAYNSTSASSYTPEVRVPLLPPAAPFLIGAALETAQDTSKSVDLSWGDIFNPSARFVIYWRSNFDMQGRWRNFIVNASDTAISPGASLMHYRHSVTPALAVGPGASLFYKIAGINDVGTSDFSATVEVPIPVTELNLTINPTLAGTRVASATFVIAYPRIPAPTEFRLERVDRGIGGREIYMVVAREDRDANTAGQILITVNIPGGDNRTHLYRVGAYRGGRLYSVSREVPLTVAPPAAVLPGEIFNTIYIAPAIEEVRENGLLRSVRFSWFNPFVNANRFYVEKAYSYYGEGENLTYFPCGVVDVPTTSFNNHGMSYYATLDIRQPDSMPNIVCYRVRAMNSLGFSGYSNSVRVITGPPKPAQNICFGITRRLPDNSVQGEIIWINMSLPAAITKYEVLRREIGGEFIPLTGFMIRQIDDRIRVLTDWGLQAGKTYQYRVRVGNAYGWSSPADSAPLTIKANP